MNKKQLKPFKYYGKILIFRSGKINTHNAFYIMKKK